MISELKSSNEVQYQCLILHPTKPLGFFGTSKGCVEIWNLEKHEILAELRYLVVNQFGDQIPIEEPVVHLDAPKDFKFVYAFMGNAAYCIDVELLTIVQQIPITETVVAGSLSSNRGEIAVVTSTGYLSQWSPRFIQRIASLELEFDTSSCYMCHDFDEDRVIMVFEEGKLVVVNFRDEPYFVELVFPGTEDLLGSIWYDKNDQYQCVITPKGWIALFTSNVKITNISSENFLFEGKASADNELRKFISNSDLSEKKRKYIEDYRLQRLSIERYLVEINSLGQENHIEPSINEDAKTLEFALDEYHSDSIEQKSRSLALIEKIAKRNDLTVRYLLYAYKNVTQNKNSLNIIELARSMEFTALHRQKNVNKVMITSVVITLIFLILASILDFSTLSYIVISFFLLIGSSLLYYWRGINTKPYLPGIKKYRGIYFFLLIVLVLGIGIYITNNFFPEIWSL